MDLIPAPAHVTLPERPGPGIALVDPVLDAGPGTSATVRWLRRELGAATGWDLPAREPGAPREPGRTVLVLTQGDTGLADRFGPEGHRLDVTGGEVRLDGAGPAGLFWAAQTLRQLLGPEAYRRAPLRPGRAWSLPEARIEDGPRFGWRGLMLDVARHFLPKDAVLRQIDLLAAHKLNVLHLHLTDDQGWRLHIERHPRLTEVGAWRPRSRRGHRASPLWNDTPHGGFYTHDDIREIVAYAAERHVRLVPEIDVPGHSQAAIAAYPHLGNTDLPAAAPVEVWDDWGVSPHVLAPTEEVLRFYEEVLEEVLELFPPEVSPFVHIGGDECPKDQWRESPAARARVAELGVGDEDGLQSWFIRHFDGWLAARGRRLIGWDEILEGGLADGAAVSSWRGYAGGVTAAEAGHDVVMCPEQHVYLDHRQDGGPEEPTPIGYVRTLEDVYRFEPVPPGLSPEATARILGAQANVWTEVMEDQRRVDYQVFPRLAAFAETVWSRLPAPEERDWKGFEARMTAHYPRLDALGVAYRPPGGPLPWQRRPGLLGRPLDGPPPVR
ncbi:beta-N-acetylhexosaminidase [Streptomyces sp. NPDC097619]|uniref:beta-N-acetylhexosaminidase n=1 Tax=Streptomyces sp. NPDC097619 TaxID=3157228 RepID=UPI00332F1080